MLTIKDVKKEIASVFSRNRGYDVIQADVVIDGEENRLCDFGRESDEDAAVADGADNAIYAYIPDRFFPKGPLSDGQRAEIARYIEANLD